ncbi:MAG TPA: ribbon-helix-helix protein, CopG family [Thermoprotei archaeon]|nr:type II toxin-antitoxin system ParD family antitoxin [Euryarchaeota archaeon]MCD6158894.1 type II toxin-antitoxin system ParD family antitoxin [Euryarchaeota archaeon]HDJ50724.1 ribbon-helix-helix protein, CopG family [Thermoprotei archaeon]
MDGSHGNLVKISVRLPKAQVEFIDSLVTLGLYVNRSDFIRDAIRDYMPKAMKKLQELRSGSLAILKADNYYMNEEE